MLSLRNPAIRALLTIGSAAAVGSVVTALPDANPAAYVLAAPVLCVLTYLFLRGPHVALTLIVAGTVFGATAWSVTAGGVDARATDLGYGALVAWVAVVRSSEGVPRRIDLGQRGLAIFLVCLGIGLLPVMAGANRDIALLVSYLRFVQTLSLVWLVPYALRSAAHRELVLRAFVIAATIELLWAMLTASGSDRLQGHLGPNAGGLVAAILLLVVLHGRIPADTVLRVAVGGIAAVGLIQSASIASITGLGVALGVFGWRTRPRNGSVERLSLLRPAQFVLLVVSVIGVIALVRPDDLPSSSTFQSSSAAHRTVLGYAGLAIFADHPIIGVGWGRSSAPDVIGTAELNDRLRERFTEVDPGLFPDKYPTSVHNAYVQVPADAGLVGLGGLLVAVTAMAPRIRRLLVRLDGRNYVVARLSTMAAVTVIVWWNDNPLFGAQPESVLFAVFLGLLGSIAGWPEVTEPSEPDERSIHAATGAAPATVR